MWERPCWGLWSEGSQMDSVLNVGLDLFWRASLFFKNVLSVRYHRSARCWNGDVQFCNFGFPSQQSCGWTATGCLEICASNPLRCIINIFHSTYVTGKPLWMQCVIIHKGWNAMLSCWTGFTMWKETHEELRRIRTGRQVISISVYIYSSCFLKQDVSRVATGYIVHKGGDHWRRADRERTSEAIGLKDKWLISDDWSLQPSTANRKSDRSMCTTTGKMLQLLTT